MVCWYSLPTELKLAVIHAVDCDDLQTQRAFSRVSSLVYALSVPLLFNRVALKTATGLSSFLDNVPQAYFSHIHHLSLHLTKSPNTSLNRLLSSAGPYLITISLVLSYDAQLSATVIPSFTTFTSLQSFSLSKLSPEHTSPLSERLVVSLALSIPSTSLREINLHRITRSRAQDAPFNPYVPFVTNDQDVPAPSTRPDSPLCLPTLLTISSLQTLRITDSHLGDGLWTSVIPKCSVLRTLELGHSVYESDVTNRQFVDRVLSTVASTAKIEELVLSTSLGPSAMESSAATPQNHSSRLQLPSLRTLSLTSLVPVNDLLPTLLPPSPVSPSSMSRSTTFQPALVQALKSSNIETVRVQVACKDDLLDALEAVEELSLQRLGGPQQEEGCCWYPKLRNIDVNVESCDGDDEMADDDDEKEREEKAEAVKELLCDLGLELRINFISPSVMAAEAQTTMELGGTSLLAKLCPMAY